jgi:hypothetical protein
MVEKMMIMQTNMNNYGYLSLKFCSARAKLRPLELALSPEGAVS